MTEYEREQAHLLDEYWTALEKSPTPVPPEGLDAELARTIQELAALPNPPEPDTAFVQGLRATLLAKATEMSSQRARRAEKVRHRPIIFGMGVRLASIAVAVLVLVLGALLASGAFGAPAVEAYGPTSMKDVSPDRHVSITFDRPMLRPLAERAVRIEPAVEGTFSWKGNELQFTPRNGWARDTTYTVSVDASARSLFLVPLPRPVTYQFMTAKDLAVLTVQPADGASDVATNSAVVVQFNYPIVALGTTRSPSPITIEPALDGKGKWITTSVYMFQPDGGFAPGTDYRVTIAKGLKDTGGSQLQADYSWKFATKAPSVSTVTPESNTRFASPKQEVRVTFDQPVDHVSAEAHFNLKPSDGDVVQGSISWDKETMVFKPASALKLDTSYTATMAAGVKSAHGDGATKEFSWSFTTVGVPRVLSTTPAQGGLQHPYDSVQIRFSNPMDPDAVAKAFSISPKPQQQPRLGWQQDGTVAVIWGGLKPSTSYTVSISTAATDRYGQKLTAPLTLKFTTMDLPPRAEPLIPGFVGSFNAAGTPILYVDHVNVSKLDFVLCKLDRSTFTRLSWDGIARKNFLAAPPKAVRRWTEKTTAAAKNESAITAVTLSASPDKKLAAGFYYLQMQTANGILQDRLLVVSRLSLTMKRAGDQVLIWATDLASGDALPDLPVRITDQDGKSLATGRTDRDGIWMGTGIQPSSNPREYKPLFAFSDAEGDPAAVSSDWAEGIRPYEFNIPYEMISQPYRGFIYTDRPIYRPGQKVEFKGILRADDDAHYSVPPAGTDVTLEMMDQQGRKLYSGHTKLNEMGAFNGELPLSADAGIGNYSIIARVGDWGVSVGFSVAEYRKPEFEVKLETDRKSYVQGDQIGVSGSANYYFGQPLANATVKWAVFSRNYFFSGPSGYQFGDPDLLRDQQGNDLRKRTEGETTTDVQGNFSFRVPADITQDLLSQVFTIEATITDDNNQEVSSRAETIVNKGEYYVGLKAERYVIRTDQPAAVDVIVVDREGKPVPNAQATVSFFNRKWNSVKERQPDGGYMWTSKPEDTLISSMTVTSDAAGKARALVQPKNAGTLHVTAEVADTRGNRTRSAINLYVSGSGFAAWRMENSSRIQLVPDKQEYSIGETARVLIPSPVPDALALVTLERGKLISHKVIRLKGNSETIEVPIQPGFVPNVYVSVVLLKGTGPSSTVATFRVGYGELKVSSASKALNVSVVPDKTKYQPGEKATYAVKTVDSSGKGVPAELSLAVVDASVLALSDDNTRDPMNVFWARRPLGTSTSATLSQSVDRSNADLTVQRKGAGGGGGTPTVRREFPDTAYWNPTIQTNNRGEASVTITVPDSLTTWKATARAVTSATQLGTGTAETTVTKSLLLRPAFPRFLLMGDHLRLAAFLNNYTDAEVEADVILTAKGVRPETGDTFAAQRVRVAPGDSQKVEWPVTVDFVPGAGAKATLKLDARPVMAGVPGDSVELTLPVNTLTTAEVVATSGEVRDSTTELVQLPNGINAALGELTVRTSPSLAAGMRYSAQYLDEFPWECTEQTVSRFLPRIVMQRAFDKAKLPDRDGIAAKLPDIVSRSIQRLYNTQGPDGGWGWWPGDGSDQWITAYAVQGLAEASRSGYTVDPHVIDRATQFLRRSLDAPTDVEHPENPSTRAYVLYVLALAGKGDIGLTNALYDRRSILGHYGQGYLLLALNSLGSRAEDAKVKSLVSDLSSVATVSASGAHWEEAQADYRTMNTDERSTAVVLDALLHAAPGNQWIQPAVRWLMVERKEGHWETTQETAWSLLALTDYLLTSDELSADFTYRLSLNGKEEATETVKRENVDETHQLVVQVKELLQGAENRVEIARAVPGQGQTGDGKLYYTMNLRYFLPSEQVDAVSQGLALVREYYRLGDEAAGPVTQVKAGDTVKVKLTLVAFQDLNYVIVEDPLPSGLEPVDTRLKTTSIGAQKETGGMRKEDEEKAKLAGGKVSPLFAWWKYDYFGHVEPRDDRVALFANFLPRGTYEYTYLAKATSAGDFQALPARGYEMYFPDVWGRSYGGKLTVTP